MGTSIPGPSKKWGSMRLKLLCLCLLYICAVSAVCASCGSADVFTTRYTENDRIDAQLRQQMHGLNHDAIDCIQADDPASLLQLMGEEAGQHSDSRQQAEQMVHQVSGPIRDLSFRHEADYYWERSDSSDAPCLILASSQNPFRVEIEGVSDRMFISLLRSEDALYRYLVGTAWAEADGQWRLYRVSVDTVEIAGKEAPDWHEEAKALYDQGYLAPALFRQRMAVACTSPAAFYHREQEQEIRDFLDQLYSEFQESYAFPMEVTEIDSRPAIYYVEPLFVQSEMLPKVKYLTAHPLQDTAAVEAEAHAMAPVVRQLFPGITAGAGYIVCTAFAEPPTDPSRTYPCYTTVVEITDDA